MTQKSSSSSGRDPRLAWLNGDWLYDELMSRIEPDLTQDKIDLLERKYADETEEEKAARMAWYEEAFVQFDAAVESFQTFILDDVRTTKKAIRAEAMEENAREEEQILRKIESDLDHCSSDAA